MTKYNNTIYQFSLTEFRSLYPQYAALVNDIDFSDPNYLVRYDTISHAFEIGYLTDEWLMK